MRTVKPPSQTNVFRFPIAAAIIALAVQATGAAAARVPEDAEQRLRAIYDRNEFRLESVQATWTPDGSGYAVLEPAAGAAGKALALYDAGDGRRAVLASPTQLKPRGADAPIAIDDYFFSPDGSWLLLLSRRDAAGKTVFDYWIFERESGNLTRAVEGATPAFFRGSIAPDGSRFVYTDKGNLKVYDLGRGKIVSLTSDGVIDKITNSQAVWSPDGKRIAYVRTDESDIPLRPMLVPGDPTYPRVRYVRYARVGGALPVRRVGIVNAKGGKTRWVDISAPAEGVHLGQIDWAMNSDELLIEKRSRGRDERDFLIAGAGGVNRIYHESDPAWVVASYRVNAGLEWIRDGEAFIVMSEKDGWRRAYVYSRDGKEKDSLTPGGVDIIQRAAVDEAGGWFYYYASPNNPTQQYLYRAPLDGSGQAERMSPADQPGWHDYEISPNAKWAIHTYSRFDQPPVVELVQLAGHRMVRTLEENRAVRKKVSSSLTQPTEFFEVDVGDGVALDGYVIKPRDFDPSNKYPVFVYQYSEPHAQTVVDRWSVRNEFHRAIADLGYLVVSMDSRGTPAPKGAAWRRAIFGSLGPLSTDEQAAGLKRLGQTRSYVDLSRVGVWGWSGGGSNTLNAMFRKPDVYHVGIAVAPKPQPHLYNAWFQEIYMRTREKNPEGYRRAAPINYAEGLQGDLLIIHGTGETNTHLEITEGLVDRLIELGKQFDYMTYPNRNHGLRIGKGTSLHLRMLMARYLLDRLPPGPRPR